jgi:MFS family permease
VRGEGSTGTIAAFGTYAVGFLARPLSATIFGHFGDRVGRKAKLAMTIVIKTGSPHSRPMTDAKSELTPAR